MGETLASYNAGKTHVLDWITWADFQEPAEFVETIPFTETREYVQSVIAMRPPTAGFTARE